MAVECCGRPSEQRRGGPWRGNSVASDQQKGSAEEGQLGWVGLITYRENTDGVDGQLIRLVVSHCEGNREGYLWEFGWEEGKTGRGGG